METKTADIIRALGGATAVAKMCNGTGGQISRQAVRRWATRDEIPPARLQYLQAIRPEVFDQSPQS
jgi:hypothetical protein